jgi:hypothetical protein
VYTEVRRDGNHTTRYGRSFGEVCLTLEDGEFSATVRRRDRSPDERLSELWSEVRTERGRE